MFINFNNGESSVKKFQILLKNILGRGSLMRNDNTQLHIKRMFPESDSNIITLLFLKFSVVKLQLVLFVNFPFWVQMCWSISHLIRDLQETAKVRNIRGCDHIFNTVPPIEYSDWKLN